MNVANASPCLEAEATHGTGQSPPLGIDAANPNLLDILDCEFQRLQRDLRQGLSRLRTILAAHSQATKTGHHARSQEGVLKMKSAPASSACASLEEPPAHSLQESPSDEHSDCSSPSCEPCLVAKNESMQRGPPAEGNQLPTLLQDRSDDRMLKFETAESSNDPIVMTAWPFAAAGPESKAKCSSRKMSALSLAEGDGCHADSIELNVLPALTPASVEEEDCLPVEGASKVLVAPLCTVQELGSEPKHLLSFAPSGQRLNNTQMTRSVEAHDADGGLRKPLVRSFRRSTTMTVDRGTKWQQLRHEDRRRSWASPALDEVDKNVHFGIRESMTLSRRCSSVRRRSNTTNLSEHSAVLRTAKRAAQGTGRRAARRSQTQILPRSSSPPPCASNLMELRASLEQIRRQSVGSIPEKISGGVSHGSSQRNSTLSVPSPAFVSNFDVLDVWTDEYALPARPVMKKGMSFGDLSVVPRRLSASSSIKCAVLPPNSQARWTWDFLSLLLVVYDSIMIPLQFILEDESPSLFLLVIARLSLIFWTADIGASFGTGFLLEDGTVERDFIPVAKRYAKSWLLLDVLIVSAEWLDIWVEVDHTSGMARVMKTARVMRLLRLTRLLRLVRLRKLFSVIKMRIRSEKLILMADFAKILVGVLFMAHLLACIWFGLGKNSSDGKRNWLDKYEIMEQTPVERYAISYHWSLAQFSGLGFDEVHPQNLAERAYGIFVTFVSFAVASCVVSVLTTTMTRLNTVGSKSSEQLATLRRYLGENGISPNLSLRVQRSAQHRLKEQERLINEKSVELLELVSEPLRAELHFEVRSPLLSEHPFMKRLIDHDPEVMVKVCHRASSVKSMSAKDVIFSQGEIPSDPQMIFVIDGLLGYTRVGSEEHCSSGGSSINVCKGQWVSEATLWTHWMHRGTLRASTECQLLALNAELFQELLLSQIFSLSVDPKRYARDFVDCLNDMDESALSDTRVIHCLRDRVSRISSDSQISSTVQDIGTKVRQFFGAAPPSP